MKPECRVCGSFDITGKGKRKTTRHTQHRFICNSCGRCGFTKTTDIGVLKACDGYLDIETTQAGKGAGNFGIVLSWAILDRATDVVVGDKLNITKRSLINDGLLVDEKRMLERFVEDVRNFNTVYTWYGTHHDIPILRTRCEYHGIDFPEYGEVDHTDLYYNWRNKFKIHSNRQDAVDEFLGADPQLWKLAPAVWVKALFGSLVERQESIEHIWHHNVEDVFQTKRIHKRIEKYMKGTRRSM